MGTPAPRTVAAGHFAPDILDFMQVLKAHAVEFLIVGGEATILHGYPRLTGDVDFFYRRNAANVNRLFAALREFWGGSVPEVSGPDELMEKGLIVQFGRPPQRIDLLNDIDGLDFDEAWQDRIPVAILGTDPSLILDYPSKEALLKNKRASGRPKDLDDVEHLS